MNTVDKIVKSKLAEYSTENGGGAAATAPRQTKTYSWKSASSGQHYASAPKAKPASGGANLQAAEKRLLALAELPWPEEEARYTDDDWNFLVAALSNHVIEMFGSAGLVSKGEGRQRIAKGFHKLIREHFQHLDPEDGLRRNITVGSK